jgi:hypothetical protein
MKTESENDERIDRFLINEEGVPSHAFTEQTLSHIRKPRQTLSFSFPIPLALALAACLVAALCLPNFLNHSEKTEPLSSPVASPEEQLYLDDILLLAEPLADETLLIDEQTIDLFAMLTENVEDL